MTTEAKPIVGILMGSKSDWETMEHASKTLDDLGIAHDVRILSAHRTPDQTIEYAAAAGGAAHLAGVVAPKTRLPVLGVPMESKSLKGLDSLLSMVQMPAGIPVATLAIGKPGAINAALFAAAILANQHAPIRQALERFRAAQSKAVLDQGDPRQSK